MSPSISQLQARVVSRSTTRVVLRSVFRKDTHRRNQVMQIYKASFYIFENSLNFPTTSGFRMKISIKMAYQYLAISFIFSPTLIHLHPLQVENCDSNSRLVVDEDDNDKFRPKKSSSSTTSRELRQQFASCSG